MANNIMCVATIPHTGTRAILANIGIRKVNRSHVIKDKSYLYLPGIEKLNNWQEGLDKSRLNVIFGHIAPWSMPIINDISNYTRIITTCRDPLASFITSIRAKKRELPVHESYKEYSEFMTRTALQFVSWKLWATEIYKLDPVIVPVDLDKKIEYNDIVFHNMKRISSFGEKYEMKKAYNRKDIDFIEKELGNTYIELVKMKDLLRPILEDIGYKNLLWW